MHHERNDHGNRHAAFPGASFTLSGCCLRHPDCEICTPVSVDGRIKYERLRSCPKCSGRSSNTHHHHHGTSTHEERSNGHHRSSPARDEGRACGKPSKPRTNRQIQPLEAKAANPRDLLEHQLPFDSKGRCHHHKGVQLATKQLGGGWKVLHESCPVCRDEVIAKVERTVQERAERHAEQNKPKTKKVVVQFDEHGFCINHPENRVAKKKVTGSWKVTNVCPHCTTKDDTSVSVYSKDSRTSNLSLRSRSSAREQEALCSTTVIIKDGAAMTQGQSQWSKVSSCSGEKMNVRGIKKFFMSSIAM